MKTKQSIAAILGFAALAYSTLGYAITQKSSAAETRVTFEDSAQFTDVKSGPINTEKGENRILASIEKAFQKEADHVLPSGYSLAVTVDDVDLAGDQEPVPPSFGEYRILKDIYPPRIAFRYTVLDANEREVASGSAALLDMNYLNKAMTPASRYSDPAAHVNDLIANWSRGELRRAIEQG